MIGDGRTIVRTREEWVCPYPVQSGEMHKVLTYMENAATASRSEVYVSADDENVIVWYEVDRVAAP